MGEKTERGNSSDFLGIFEGWWIDFCFFCS